MNYFGYESEGMCVVTFTNELHSNLRATAVNKNH